jgi:predicted metal-binding protein
MTDIGILTCSNTTQDVGCSVFGCLRAVSDGVAPFSTMEYPDGARVVGVISCAGCAGKRSHEKILRRVGALVASGARAIHLATCLVDGCPFVARYEHVIGDAYPGVAVVRGSHARPPQAFLNRLEAALVAPRQSVPEIAAALRAGA